MPEPTPQRARNLGIPFDGVPGPWNAITDVSGVEVGFTTLCEEAPDVIRTGVTVIFPRGRSTPASPCAAGVSSLNGNGELTGRSWIDESGQFQTPIGITNSHAVGVVHHAIDTWLAERDPVAAAQWMLPVVGETWDGYLNSINSGAITEQHVWSALNSARPGPLPEGNIGGGAGMNCYGFKGGTGTASRVITTPVGAWTVGVLLQANFGARNELCIAGKPLGRSSAAPCPIESGNWFEEELGKASGQRPGAGSVIVIVATDAPLLPDQCRALARRVPLGLARTGTSGSHFSGDIFLAFSTANQDRLRSRLDTPVGTTEQFEFLSWGGIDPLYEAVVQATEEAVMNALVAARTMHGRGDHISYALPHEEVKAAFDSSL